jgi:hypothetical protein
MIARIFLGRLCIQRARFTEPTLHFVINIRRRRDRDAAGAAILLRIADGVDEADGVFSVLAGETEIDYPTERNL